jgi:NAD(P)-dependent dehydrogenase (short-subunit alcohol dehydrogenase family)
MSQIVERCGGVDVLVNNAGVGCSGPVETVTHETAQATFDVNYFGAMRMTRAVIPGMREQGAGAIVNVTSIASRFPTGGSAHYTASKIALEGASECLAMEVARFNIRVALIEPGIILTPIFGKQTIPPLPVPAYEADYRRWGAFVQQRIRKRTLPSAVVTAVMDAINSPMPRFRYPVGEDAELLSAMRANSSDTQLLSAASGTDDEYYDAMAQLVGTDLWR